MSTALIQADPGVMMGKPIIAGTRITAHPLGLSLG